MNWHQITLPGLALLISLAAKLFIGRPIDGLQLLKASLELPVDLSVLALSFAIAYTLLPETASNTGLAYALADTLAVLVTAALWQKALPWLTARGTTWAVMSSTLFAYGVSSVALVLSIALLTNAWR